MKKSREKEREWEVASSGRNNQLSNEIATYMVREVFDQEIKDAIFAMGDNRAPGPDGYTAAFFKETWDIIANDSVFVPGRRIYDNILLTQDLMLNYHLDRGTPQCAFKVDIQKAYDTVDWGFLHAILIGFGFHSRMIG
ncbi:hypothetical protein Tco_1428502 [Tanacetum coccineum]